MKRTRTKNAKMIFLFITFTQEFILLILFQNWDNFLKDECEGRKHEEGSSLYNTNTLVPLHYNISYILIFPDLDEHWQEHALGSSLLVGDERVVLDGHNFAHELRRTLGALFIAQTSAH